VRLNLDRTLAAPGPGDRNIWRPDAARRRLESRLQSLARQAPLDASGSARVGRRHIYILPTGSGLALGAVLALMLLGSLNYQNNLGLLFTFLLGSAAIVAMHHSWFNLLGLEVSARGGAPVFAGQDGEVSVTLGDTGNRPRSGLAVGLGKATAGPRDIPAGGRSSAPVAVPTARRGYRYIHQIQLETRYPIGLFRAWCYARVQARITVYPQPARRALEPPLSAAYRANTKGDLGVGADDFVGFRDYRSGDSLRHLDWKALARERGLVIKKFGGDRADEVWLDWDRLPAVDLEERVSLLCRQVLDAAECGLSYGLRLPSRQVPIGHGELHKHRCLETLAIFDHA
jgi:uncharacterized protein (DUF58 family)